jgi:hypothetical protein
MHRTLLMWIGGITVLLILIAHPQIITDLAHAFTDTGSAVKASVSH